MPSSASTCGAPPAPQRAVHRREGAARTQPKSGGGWPHADIDPPPLRALKSLSEPLTVDTAEKVRNPSFSIFRPEVVASIREALEEERVVLLQDVEYLHLVQMTYV
jgi:hypothetical protein